MDFKFLFEDNFITLLITFSLFALFGFGILLYLKYVKYKGNKLEIGDWLFSFGFSAILTTFVIGGLSIISD